MNLIYILSLVILLPFGESDSSQNKVDNTPCDLLQSSTERITRTFVYHGGDIYVKNPSAVCDQTETVFSIQRVKVNGLKIDFKLDQQNTEMKIPLSELNIKMDSEVKIEIYHYSFARPEFLSN